MSKHGLQVIENDALVVLCMEARANYDGNLIPTTHYRIRDTMRRMGYQFSASKVHSMLSRAGGRVRYDAKNKEWRLTAAGLEYRLHVVDTLRRLTTAVTT